jgi:hypothetical protein
MKKVFNIFKIVQTVVDLLGNVVGSLKKQTEQTDCSNAEVPKKVPKKVPMKTKEE